MLAREWFSTAELAAMALPGMPATQRGVAVQADRDDWQRAEWKGQRWREREGRGGGVEYHYSLLPQVAQIKLTVDLSRIEETSEREAAKREQSREEMWRWYERLPDGKKAKALKRLEVLDAVALLVLSGLKKTFAAQQVAAKFEITLSSLYNWQKLTYGIDRHDWLPFLAPRHAGRTESVACDPQVWEALKGAYLRLGEPTFKKCYLDLTEIATANGWKIPAERTLQRRLEALPKGLLVLARKGPEALKRTFPAQRRDRGVFHALEAVNADGHQWDVFVRWPDGYVGRPMMVSFQDLYSGKLLSWRIDRSENKEAVRLAFGDVVENYGIPDHCWFDNGHAFASKWITGGIANRYQFTVKDEDPEGILTQLGVEVHWATPHWGQAKPIERAHLDFARDIAKHTRFDGAYTGNSPMTKPENYGQKAVPLDVFLATIRDEIIRHNARTGRRAATCHGRSFDETFNESYAKSPIRKATAEQRRLWLLAAEALRVSKVDGIIEMFGNRYWAEFLHGYRGQRLTVHFDPDALKQPVHVYRLDGAFIGSAPCVEDAGFNDVDAARDHARERKRFERGHKDMLDAERKMTPAQFAELLPEPAPPEPLPPPRVVRLVAGMNALNPVEVLDDEENPADAAVMNALRQRSAALAGGGHLRVVNPDDGD